MSGHALRIAGFVLVGLAVLAFGIRFALGRVFNTGGAPADAVQKTAVSRDGTGIAYEQTGAGPVVILVSAALADRDGARPLARQLAQSFTVVNYDRRGRGKSGNAKPYSVEREVEDVAALANGTPGAVFLFGSSSGSVLALDAASRLGPKVKKVCLYEPPFIVDGSRPPIPDALAEEITTVLSANDRGEAVAPFFGKGMGIPPPGIVIMRLFMPAWSDMKQLAHTIPYDLTLLAGTQSGKPLPVDRWSAATSPALVAVGARSEQFFHSGANALTGRLPGAEYRSLDGLDHSAVLVAPAPPAAAMRQFFGSGQ